MAETPPAQPAGSPSKQTDSNSATIKPGDVVINTVELTCVNEEVLNLKPFLAEIHLYEDIFSPALQGHIVIRDSQNLIGKLPIVGDEVLTLDIQTPDFGEPGTIDLTNKIQKSFAVYAIKDRKLTGDKEQLYILYFCSLEAIMDNITKISERFTGTTDAIASTVYEKFIKIPRWFSNKISLGENQEDPTELNISDAPHESYLTVVPAMWSPMYFLTWLSKRSIGANNKAPNYLFFETKSSFYFTSIESMVQTQLEENAIYSDFIFQTNLDNLTTQGAISKGYQTVEAVKFLTNVDILQGQDLGHFASSLYTFDMVKKDLQHYTYDHGFAFGDYKHMESYKQSGDEKPVLDDTKKFNMIYPITVTRSGDSKRYLETIHPGLYGSKEDSIDLHPEKYVQPRVSSLLDISTLKMEITVPGRTDCEVGKMINFYYPSVGNKVSSDSEADIWDEFVSGVYMITAIHHQITPFHHNMYLEISKDSFFKPIYDVEAEGGEISAEPTPAQDPKSTPTSTEPPVTAKGI
jgi:hypothetical protein